MINFYKEGVDSLSINNNIIDWISHTIVNENKQEGDISYIFCNDEYLLDKNIKYLKHNTLTDIISFDYTLGSLVSGDIFISIERVEENAKTYEFAFIDELHRVMIHGILHFCGYKDKTKEEKYVMRSKEDYYLSLRTF